jgi:hypothetical protein
LPVEQQGNRWVVRYPDGSIRTVARQDEARAIAESGTQPTKYSTYTVPGGENYRETLLTLPEQGEQGFQRLLAQREAVNREIDAYHAAHGDDRFAPHPPELVARYNALQNKIDAMQSQQFTSSHWEQPNVVVHTRSNERVLPTGERGRFLEEIQSDWHQQGKQKGYRIPAPTVDQIDLKFVPPTVPEGHSPRNYPGYWEAFDRRTNELIARAPGEYGREGAMAEALRGAEAFQEGRVPNAPFKESWPDLALKHQLLDAAQDPNLSWIGMTGGETQAARYNLRKHVDEIHYQPREQRLLAFTKDADKAIDEIVAPEKLANYIGKEAAEKLLAQPFDKEYRSSHVLRGAELEIGGEGMKKFYDELLPKRLEKIVKPFGGKVERMGVPGTTDYGWMVRLSPEMKAKIVKAGLPLMMVPLAVMGRPQTQQGQQ